jgi:hypothetical protein
VLVLQKLTAAGKSGSGADEVDAQTGLHTKPWHFFTTDISSGSRKLLTHEHE